MAVSTAAVALPPPKVSFEGPFLTPDRAMLEIVGRIHELGFPVMAVPCLSPSGMHWRCTLTIKALTYSTASNWNLFADGKDCSKLSLTELTNLALKALNVDMSQRPLWSGQAKEDEILFADYWSRALEVTAPDGNWINFSDYGGFEIHGAKLANVPSFEVVQHLWSSKRLVHPFLVHDQRHALADCAKNGMWVEVWNILKEHPRWVNQTRPILGNKSPSGYTLMHQAVWSGITDAVKTLIDLGGAQSLIRSSKDGTPLQLAQREKRNHLVPFLKPL